MKQRQNLIGFTLIELLVVIGVIAVLAAIIFPVFSRVRERGRQAACLSNMRQIGMAIAMYATDSDNLYPSAADPSDLYTPIWTTTTYAAQVKTLPLLQNVMQPYVSDPNIWCCPSDTGYDYLDMTFFGGSTTGLPLNARPTMFKAYGTSYLYRTELALRHEQITVGCKGPTPQSADTGPEDVNVLMDGNGGWHGSPAPLTLGLIDERRYNVLMGDGHMTNCAASVLNDIWSCSLG